MVNFRSQLVQSLASEPQILMSEKLFEFMTSGTPRAVSGAVEQLAIDWAASPRSSYLGKAIVPRCAWRSASTQAKAAALEHTNLGTVRLTDMAMK